MVQLAQRNAVAHHVEVMLAPGENMRSINTGAHTLNTPELGAADCAGVIVRRGRGSKSKPSQDARDDIPAPDSRIDTNCYGCQSVGLGDGECRSELGSRKRKDDSARRPWTRTQTRVGYGKGSIRKLARRFAGL